MPVPNQFPASSLTKNFGLYELNWQFATNLNFFWILSSGERDDRSINIAQHAKRYPTYQARNPPNTARLRAPTFTDNLAFNRPLLSEDLYLALKHSQNNIQSCKVIGWAFKNCSCKRLAHLRRANPKSEYSLAHICYCIRQTVREGGNEIVNAQQKAVAFRAGNDSIARGRALRLSRVVLDEEREYPISRRRDSPSHKCQRC